MKRTISWVLVMVLVLGLFAGCGATTETPAEPTNAAVEAAPTEAVVAADENLANTIEYLKAYYKGVKDGDLTPADFERLGTVRVGTTAYEVVYTVDCDESVVKIVKGENGMVLIDVNEENEDEVTYTLTATITGTDGKTATMSWTHVVPASMSSDEIVDAAYALEDGEALGYEATLTGEIISVDTPYSADYKNITVSIKVTGREDKPIMCYRLKGEGADALGVGDIITVTGILMNYKGTIEFDAGCVLEKVEKGSNSVEVPTDPQEILEAAFSLPHGQYLPYPATLTGKIVGIRYAYSEQYGNVSVVIKTGQPWYLLTCFRMKGEGVDKIWLDDVITVTGNITNYNGTIEFDAGCQLVSWTDNPDPVAPSDPAEILKAAYTTLGHRDTLPYPCGLTGKVDSKWNDKNDSVTVNMTVPGCEDMPVQCFRMKGDEAKNIEAGDTITVYGWLMNYNGTIEFMQGCSLVKLVKGEKPETPEQPEEGASITIAEALALVTTDNNVKITGTITEIKSTAWGNMYINDGTGSIYIYGLYDAADNRYDAMTNPPAVGDTITVFGKVSQYNGAQIKNAVLEGSGSSEPDPEQPETPEQPEEGASITIAEALALVTTDNNVKITGTITEIKSTAWGNMYINDGTGSIYIYGLYDAADNRYDAMTNPPAVGDTITVFGKVSQYNGAQIKNAVLEGSGSSESDPEQPEEEPETPTLSTPEEIVAAAFALASGETLSGGPFTLTGTVAEITDAYDESFGTLTLNLTVAGKTIECKYVGGDKAATVAAGETITVSGNLQNYKGTVQIYKGAIVG